MQQKSDMQMRELSPYSAAFTREQFLFYEMRVTAKLLCEGLEAGEVVDRVAAENLFQYPTERSVRKMAHGCLRRLSALGDESLVRALAVQPSEVSKQICLYAMMKQYTSLEKGGRMAVLMGDIKKKGQFYSMLAEIIKPGTLENIIIKAQHNCFSDKTRYSGSFIPILHEYVMIVRKDNALICPVLISEKKQIDIRDIPGATWRDVVAAVLEQCKEPVTLTFLYEQIEPHKKAQANKWWKEKIRQTLQYHPEHFQHMDRGLWKLRTKK